MVLEESEEAGGCCGNPAAIRTHYVGPQLTEGGCEAQSDNRSLLPLSTEMHIPGLTPETASLAHLARCPETCSFSKQLVLMISMGCLI